MMTGDDKGRMAIAQQAAEWYVAHDAHDLGSRDSDRLTRWLKTSPVHIEELLGVAAVTQTLADEVANPQYSLDAILARARAPEGSAVRLMAAPRRAGGPFTRPRLVFAALAACALLALAIVPLWNGGAFRRPPQTAELRISTQHGERLTRRLSDGSVLSLNSESTVVIRYERNERRVRLVSGEADFQVIHQADRPFRVLAGPAEVRDVGTRFDILLATGTARITVSEGEVEVHPPEDGTDSGGAWPAGVIKLRANERVTVDARHGPSAVERIDASRAAAWLHGEIVFEQEPLKNVVAEFNRYATRRIEITTPALREVAVSGSFAIDDKEAFVAFLQRLKGARVQMLGDRIQVSQD